MSAEPILFEDSFTILTINSAKYDRVSRISATTTSLTAQQQQQAQSSSQADQDATSAAAATAASNDPSQIALTLDVNTELYNLQPQDRVQIALASTLNLDGSKDDERKGWRPAGHEGESTTLADEYDYVCHGKIYRFEEGQEDDIKVFVSFGGLLLYLEGPYAKLNPLRLDYVYLLMKR